MKLKKEILSTIISTVLILFPTYAYAAVASYEYNFVYIGTAFGISILMLIFIIGLAFFKIRYVIKLKDDRKNKFIEILKTIAIICILIILGGFFCLMLLGAGITEGNSSLSHTIFKPNIVALILSHVMRIVASCGIIFDIGYSIYYYIKSKTEINIKISNIVKCLMIVLLIGFIVLIGASKIENIGGIYIEKPQIIVPSTIW